MFDPYRTARRRMPRWLDEVYHCAHPWSWEEWQRLNHLDLSAMSLPELRRELGRLRIRLHIDPEPDPWLLERHAALDAEIDRRAPARSPHAA
jgi:hypothetical protein